MGGFTLFCILIVCFLLETVYSQASVDILIGFDPTATHFVLPKSDISVVLQDTLNSLSNQGGGKVTIAQGTYFISQSIVVGSNISIIGQGVKSTTLKIANLASIFQKKGVLHCSGNNNIVITHLTIDGNKFHQSTDQGKYVNPIIETDKWYGRYGLYCEACSNVLYDDVQITNFQIHGVYITGNSNSIAIVNSLVTYNDFTGIHVDNTFDVLLFNTTTKTNGLTGISIEDNTRNVIVNQCSSYRDALTYPSSSGCGLQIDSIGNTVSNVTITNNLVVEPKNIAICLSRSKNVWIENNNLYTDNCVDFEYSNEVVVTKNLCVNPDVLRVIQANNLNVNVTISDNTLQIGRYVNQVSENMEIVIGYSDKATYIIEQGADAYQEVQQSLDMIRLNGGGILRFESGLYILSSYIELGSNTSIIGAGINETILKLMDRADPWWIPNTGYRRSGFIRSTQTVNLFFANFTIDGNKDNQNTDKYSEYGRYGFFTEAVDNVTVDGMGIINFQGYGFDPHGIKETKRWSIGLTIINSYSANNGWDGYTIDQSVDVLLQNNVAYNNGRHGFNIVTGSYNVMMYNNIAIKNGFYYYSGAPGCGLAVQNNLNYGTRNISAINNIFQDNDDAGICIRNVADILLENNTITNVNYTDVNVNLCLKVSESINVVLQNNTCNNTLYVPFVRQPIVRSPPPPNNSKSPPSPITLSPQYKNGGKIVSPPLMMILVTAFTFIL